MNKQSLQHRPIENQQQSSWTDDPFELKGAFKGLTVVTNARNLTEYAQELAYDYGKYVDGYYALDLNSIASPYQLELARLYIESIDRDIENACFGEDQTLNSDFLCSMLAMLKDSTPKTRANFAQVTTRNILAYYKEPLQYVLDEACHDLLCNMQSEIGQHSYQDKDSGEIFWSKY